MNLNKLTKIPFCKQAELKDCGATCLRIISKYYNKNISIQYLRKVTETSRSGSSLLNLSDASEKIGFRSLGVKMSVNAIKKSTITLCFALE